MRKREKEVGERGEGVISLIQAAVGSHLQIVQMLHYKVHTSQLMPQAPNTPL